MPENDMNLSRPSLGLKMGSVREDRTLALGNYLSKGQER